MSLLSLETIASMIPQKLLSSHPILGIVKEVIVLKDQKLQDILSTTNGAQKKAQQVYDAIGQSTTKEDPRLLKLAALTVLHSGRTDYKDFINLPAVVEILASFKAERKTLNTTPKP